MCACSDADTDLVHEDLNTGVQARSHSVVQDTLEPLLFPHDRIQEVGLVDVLRHLLVKVDLNHALDRVTDMDELKELK